MINRAVRALRALIIACVGVALAIDYAATAASIGTVVHTQSGPVRGAGSEVIAFNGIPYAAAPIGERRWRPPDRPAAWTTVRDATEFGPQCPQTVRGGVLSGAARASSEDCLTLNVWTPASASGDGLPVMVWFHGGGFAAGSGSWPEFDAAALARRGVIVVTVNYRLGALGFLPKRTFGRSRGASGYRWTTGSSDGLP